MNKSHIKLIKERYENAVHEYCIAFCQKHGYHYNPDGWVGGDVGGVIEVADIFVNFDDIRIDIDNEVPQGIFEQYCSYISKLDGKKIVNYKHYIYGCRPYSEEQLAKIKEMKDMINNIEVNKEGGAQ